MFESSLVAVILIWSLHTFSMTTHKMNRSNNDGSLFYRNLIHGLVMTYQSGTRVNDSIPNVFVTFNYYAVPLLKERLSIGETETTYLVIPRGANMQLHFEQPAGRPLVAFYSIDNAPAQRYFSTVRFSAVGLHIIRFTLIDPAGQQWVFDPLQISSK